MSMALIWAVLGLIFVFFEFFIPGLVIIFFGIGALVTAIPSYFFGQSFSPELQFVTFMSVSVLSLILLRKYFKKIFTGEHSGEGEIKNFNLEIGKIVPVTELIKPGEIGGKVRYMGSIWNAKCEDEVIPGESVVIDGRDNLTLIVKKIKKEK